MNRLLILIAAVAFLAACTDKPSDPVYAGADLEFDPTAEMARVSWCQGPTTLGCQSAYKHASIPIGERIADAVVVEPSAVGWKWFKHDSGPQGCLFTTGPDGHSNGRDFPAPDGSGRGGFFSQGFAPIKGIAGGNCARFGITTDSGLLSAY